MQVIRNGRQYYKLADNSPTLAKLQQCIDAQKRKTCKPRVTGGVSRVYPKLANCKNTADYVRQFYALNNLHIPEGDLFPDLFQPMRDAPIPMQMGIDGIEEPWAESDGIAADLGAAESVAEVVAMATAAAAIAHAMAPADDAADLVCAETACSALEACEAATGSASAAPGHGGPAGPVAGPDFGSTDAGFGRISGPFLAHSGPEPVGITGTRGNYGDAPEPVEISDDDPDGAEALEILGTMAPSDDYDYLVDFGTEPADTRPEALRAAVLADIARTGPALFCARMQDLDGDALKAQQVQAWTAARFAAVLDHLTDINYHGECLTVRALRIGRQDLADESRAINREHVAAGGLTCELADRRRDLDWRIMAAEAGPASDAVADSQPMEIPALPAPEPEPMGNAAGGDLVKSISIANLCNQRAAVMERINKAAELLREAAQIAGAANLGMPRIVMSTGYSRQTMERNLADARIGGHDRTGSTTHLHGSADDDIAKMVRLGVDSAGWQHLMHESGMRSLMDATAREKWDKSISEGDIPELTEANIRSTFSMLHDSRADIFERGVIECFKRLSWHYRTNLPEKFGKRIVVANLTGYHGHRRCNELDDLIRVMHVLEGKPEPDHRTGMYAQLAAKGLAYAAKTGAVENDYLSIRVFKNTNGHVTFKRPDLVDRMNGIIAKHYPGALPAPR